MRILFVAPYPPSRIRTRLYGFVTHLAMQHTVEVLALCQNSQEMADAWELRQAGIEVTVIQDEQLAAWWRCAIALPSTLPLQVAFAATPRLRAAIENRLRTGFFDLVHVESLRALGALPTSLSLPVIWDAVDCMSALYASGQRAGATWKMRLAGLLELRRLPHYELEQMRRFPFMLVTAERERQCFLQLAKREPHQGEIVVLPHGIDQEYFRPYSGKRQEKTLVFSGRMSFHANIVSVHWLIKNVMPQVWRWNPDIRLIIAGSDPPGSIRRLALDRRIEVTGYLPDLRLVISQGQVALAPLLYAAGIQNKLLEAMALGTPVIASRHAAAGLQALPGHDLLVEDRPDKMAAAIIRLLEDQALWKQLARNGTAYVAAHHRWEHIIEQLTRVYQQAVVVRTVV